MPGAKDFSAEIPDASPAGPPQLAPAELPPMPPPKVRDFSVQDPVPTTPALRPQVRPYNVEEEREGTRGALARGLIWLLGFAIGGILLFVGFGRLEGAALTQSVLPSLVALAGTALGFYFGVQAAKGNDTVTPGGTPSRGSPP